MKKKVIIITSVLVSIILLGIGFYLYLITSNNPKEPEKFTNIPQEAIWRGAVDEGFWIYIVDINENEKVIRLNIYNDYNGELALDARFDTSNCQLMSFSKESIYENIIAFASSNGIESRDEIMMKNECGLKMIEPAYGGTFKDVNK
jgi:hypothetical protein